MKESPARRDASSSPARLFTPRERQVLALLIEGLTNRQIAVRLGCKPHAVKKALELMHVRVGSPNRTALAVQAVKGNWLGSSAVAERRSAREILSAMASARVSLPTIQEVMRLLRLEAADDDFAHLQLVPSADGDSEASPQLAIASPSLFRWVQARLRTAATESGALAQALDLHDE